MARFYYVNNLRTELAVEASTSASTIEVADDSRIGTIPDGLVLALTLISLVNPDNVEIVYATANSSGVLTVQRGQEGTNWGGDNYDNWPAGTIVEGRITAGMLSGYPQGLLSGGHPLGNYAVNIQAVRGDPDNIASGEHSIVVGAAKASDYAGVSIGVWSQSTSYGAVALGSEAEASGAQAVAVGMSAKALANSPTVALGAGAEASGEVSTAVGSYAKAQANSPTLAVGSYAQATGEVSTAIGQSAGAAGDESVALGSSSQSFHSREF